MESYAAADEVWAAGLVFARVGAVVMLLPGIGEQVVPPRIRLAFAFVLSLALFPIVSPGLPPLPETVGGMGGWVIRETAVGLIIGGMLRMMMAALAVAGEIVALQTTLAFAQTTNPLQAQPGGTLGAFLGLLGVTLVFAADLHHLFVAAIVDSYQLFSTSRETPLGDSVQLAIATFGTAFSVGVQLAAPVIVFALVFNIATGFVGRVMPQFQVFFVAAPLNILLGLSVFALSLGVLGLAWIEAFRSTAAVFVRS